MLRLSALCLIQNALAARISQVAIDLQYTQQHEIPGRPSICAADVVKETGVLIDTSGGDGQSICSFSELQELLSASEASVAVLWKELELPWNEGPPELHSAPCSDVCNAVARMLKDHRALPPASDTGCTILDGHQICDIDLTPKGIGGLVNNSRSLPDFHNDCIIEQEQKLQKPSVESGSAVHEFEAPISTGKLIDYESWTLLRKIANLFRIYPASMATAVEVQQASSFVETMSNTSDKDWRKAVMKKTEEARAVLTTALRLFRAEQSVTEITVWFGKDASTNKEIGTEMLRIINSVDNMLDQVEYVFPGEDCGPSEYAYVYPSAGACDSLVPKPGKHCTKNSGGRFIFYLCSLYMERVDEQIEVLLHEGSHHATAFTKDVCMDDFYMGYNSSVFLAFPTSTLPQAELGKLVWVQTPSGYPTDYFKSSGSRSMANVWQVDDEKVVVKMYFGNDSSSCEHTAYGRDTCQMLPKLSPWLAIRNADNFCYFISDVGATFSKRINSKSDTCIHIGDFCVGDRVLYKGDAFVTGPGETISFGEKGVVIFPGFQETDSPYRAGDKIEVLSSGKWSLLTVTQTKPLEGKYYYYFGFTYRLAEDRVRLPGGQEQVFVRFDDKLLAINVDNDKLLANKTDTKQLVTASTVKNEDPSWTNDLFSWNKWLQPSGCFQTVLHLWILLLVGSVVSS